MATTNNRLPVRAPPEGNLTPAAPRPAGSALLSLAQALIDKSKKAGGSVAQTGGRAARAVGRGARAVGRAAPEKVADIAIEEGASLGSHLLTHTTHRYAGGLAVGVKGGLELLALVVAKVKRASPRVLRGLRSTLRGTLHHSLGTGLHKALPIPEKGATKAAMTSGADEGGGVEGEDEGGDEKDSF